MHWRLGKPRLRYQLMATGVGALVLLAGVQALWYRNLRELIRAMTLVDQQNRLLGAVQSAAGSVKDAELIEREYMQTGDRSRFRSFEDAQLAAADQMRFAGQLAGTPDSTAVHAIDRSVAELLAHMHRRMERRSAGAVRASQERDSAAVEMRELEEVRLAVLGFNTLIQGGLDARRFASGAAVSRTVAITGLVFLAAFAIAGRLLVQLEREIARRRDAEAHAIEAKEEAERMSRAKSEFLAHISHELRTPLNSVIGFSNVLLRKVSGQDAVYLERVRANGAHLLALIENLLDLAKIEAGREEIELSIIPLDSFIRETVHELEGRLVGGSVALETDIPPVVPVLADMRKLKQVLINLVGNALKFTEAGRVTVRVRSNPRSGEALAIDVIDTGIGIPNDRQRTIFNAFEQADAGTSRRYGGTGLGLTIARSYCELMGYGISVASAVGKGSTFTIDLTGRAGRGREGYYAADGAPRVERAVRAGVEPAFDVSA